MSFAGDGRNHSKGGIFMNVFIPFTSNCLKLLLINTKYFYLKKYRIPVNYENPMQFLGKLAAVSFLFSVFMAKPILH